MLAGKGPYLKLRKWRMGPHLLCRSSLQVALRRSICKGKLGADPLRLATSSFDTPELPTAGHINSPLLLSNIAVNMS
jgi:hypothetical protein